MLSFYRFILNYKSCISQEMWSITRNSLNLFIQNVIITYRTIIILELLEGRAKLISSCFISLGLHCTLCWYGSWWNALYLLVGHDVSVINSFQATHRSCDYIILILLFSHNLPILFRVESRWDISAFSPWKMHLF